MFFALVWNGIVSILMLFVISGKLHNLHVPLPGWFPAPRTESGGAMSVGMTLFLWIFLTPFILVGLFVAGCCLSSLFGRTEVLLAGS